MIRKQTLESKIRNREAIIGIIYLGYVGLPLVIRFGEEGFRVVGFDIDDQKVQKLNNGESYIKHIPDSSLSTLRQSGAFEATSDYLLLSRTDCLIICVPTPLNSKKEPDLSFVQSTAAQIAAHLRPGQLVSLESTTYPGTTREILLPHLNSNGLSAGRDYFLVYSPEREDPGNPNFHTKNIPKVVGGFSPDCTQLGRLLYEQIVEEVIVVSSPEVAEFTKILENTFRSVNIAPVNELKMLADKMGVDIWEVINAASTKPFGFMPFYLGPGLGGHCIPIDPYYLSWKAKEYNFCAHFIELAGEINTNMPYYVVTRLSEALNRQGKCLKNSKLSVLGVAYKKDVDDMRESPALEILNLLRERGAEIHYNDPYIAKIPKLRKYEFNLESFLLTKTLLKDMDAVIIVTGHSSYDYEWIIRNSNLVLNTRNATASINSNKDKIIKA
jgi:UDP-N-acetyl-D-glucosamine dehydrogenase